MKPKHLMLWAVAITSVLLVGCGGFCAMHEMLKRTHSLDVILLTPRVGEALVVLVVASVISTLVVGLTKVRAGTVQFSGLGVTFQGLACHATIWVVVFATVSVAFLALIKCLAAYV